MTSTVVVYDWLLRPEIWIIIGLILIGLEVLLDGSMAIFLPLGLAALFNGALIYLQESQLFGDTIFMDSWDDTLVPFVIFAVIAAFALRYYARHRKTDDTPDINKY